MPLERRLLLALVAPGLLVALVGLVGIGSLNRLGASAGRILSDNYHSIQEARKMERLLRRLEALSAEPADASRASRAQALAEAFETALARCERNITEEEEAPLLEEVRRVWTESRRRPGASSFGWSAAVDASLYRTVDAVIDRNEEAMIRHERAARRQAGVLVAVLASSLVLALAGMLVFARVAARQISRPILAVADHLHETLGGGAPGQAGRPPADEIERLRRELAGLLERFSRHEEEQSSRFARLEERLALVLEEVLEGLVLVDDSFRILMWNETARRILAGPTEGPAPATLAEVPPESPAHDALRAVLHDPPRAERNLPELRVPPGEAGRIYQPRILPFRSGPEGPEGYLWIFWDVTEERQFEESRRRFIAMLSHQLKTPMTSLTMAVNLLWERRREEAPQEAELLSMAREDCAVLSNLLSELIGAARDVTPSLAVRPRPCDLVPLLRGALRPLKSQAAERGVALVEDLGEAGRSESVDPVKFPWVVTNLVGNALRYTPAGGEIRVVLGRGGGALRLAVSDTGAGIAPGDLDRIFTPYLTLDGDPTPGTHGLGLAIAREVVEAHHGSIEVQSRLGEGTTFTIRIPEGGGGPA